MKIKRDKERRDQPGTGEHPAGKRRKVKKHEYKRVLQEKKEAKKRAQKTNQNRKTTQCSTQRK